MTRFGARGFGLIDWVGAAFSSPLVSLALAVLAAGVFLVFVGARGRRRELVSLSEAAARSVRSRYMPERRILGIAALAVIVVFAAENVIRGYLLNLVDVVSWWRFATPLASSFLAIVVLAALVLLRGSAASESPVVTGVRRSWTTFGPRVGLIVCGIVLVVLVGTTIAAGVASVADDHGRYIWLEIPIPNEGAIDPIRLWFYGWAFGVPVLIALGALIAATGAVLHLNAARAFIRPDTVSSERALRAEVASGTVSIATAGMLLALAGAWRLIASAGSTWQLVIEGQNGGNPYEAVWRFAELGAVAGWLAPAIEIVAFTLLFLVASELRRGTTEPSADAKSSELVEAMESEQ
ncbi:hypothetical protein AB1K54_13920 [Microbacterium sp. BWT-B31]|uniref:hypothetical protein n=1 Tax=Microbacterium sp. BWT-B31 TaxID=3232072 RepID=UPI003528A538